MRQSPVIRIRDLAVYEQLSLFPKGSERPPETVTWNLIHGCRKLSPGCLNCYVYRRDGQVGRDASVVTKTKAFDLPVRRYRSGEYRIPPGSLIYTCFSSDFFLEEADAWRSEAWAMMRERSDCTFFLITKRPERIAGSLPPDWGSGYENVQISCTCENQAVTDRRLPVYLELPIRHKSITHEPMLGEISIRGFLERYRGEIEHVSCGGESGPDARVCDYDWVLNTHRQCLEFGVPFTFHQTGAKLLKDGKLYLVPRKYQHIQAKKAGLDFPG